MLGKIGIAVLVAASGCGAARVIQRSPQGGIIELQGDKVKAMEDANQQMADHCGAGNFSILLEGDEPAVPPNGTKPTTTRTATVWRVHYACGASGQPVAAPQPTDLDPAPAAGAPSQPPPPGP